MPIPRRRLACLAGMRIKLICIGKTREAYLQEALDDYLQRLRRYTDLEYIEVKTEKYSKSLSTAEIQQREWAALQKKITPQEFVVVLDEHGEQQTSAELAHFIARCQQRGDIKILTFVTGGATGFAVDCVRNAQNVLALSRMTFPHQLCRVILAEQLYRAYTILAGESYHKE